MKIGIFDSGLGGLIILKSIQKKLPQYDYVYLGDTKRLPYGDKSEQTIYKYSTQCVDYLFKQDCSVVIVACNTVSSRALRKLQQEYLPKHYPDRNILGVVVPTAEEVTDMCLSPVGIIGTSVTVNSKAYIKELKKRNSKIQIKQKPTPLLVPAIEAGQMEQAKKLLARYLKPFNGKIRALILGCTHYCLLKDEAKKLVGKDVVVMSQDDIIPEKLAKYLAKHKEITKKLSKSRQIKLLVTETSLVYTNLAKQWFGSQARLKKIKI